MPGSVQIRVHPRLKKIFKSTTGWTLNGRLSKSVQIGRGIEQAGEFIGIRFASSENP